MDNLEEMDRFLEKFNLTRLKQEKIEIMNKPIRSIKIETVIKNSHTHTHKSHTVQMTNIFKELDLIDRGHEELWLEVRDIV